MSEPTVTELGLGAFAAGVIAAGGYGFDVSDSTDTQVGERYLDPRLGGYAERDGTILKSSPTRQRVINLIIHRRGTSLAVRGYKAPEYHDESTERLEEAQLRSLLQPLVDEGAIVLQLVRVTRQRPPGRLGIDITYLDTATGQTEGIAL